MQIFACQMNLLAQSVPLLTECLWPFESYPPTTTTTHALYFEEGDSRILGYLTQVFSRAHIYETSTCIFYIH